MTAVWITLGVLLGVALLWVLSRGRFYKRLYSDEHLLEFADQLAEAKRAAWSMTGEAPNDLPTEDPRCFITSANIAVFYTVDFEDEGFFANHLSLSLAGSGYTPRVVGALFSAYVAHLLGLPTEAISVGVSDRTVHHIGFAISENDGSAFAAMPVEIPQKEDVRKVFSDCLDARARLRYDENFSVTIQ